MKTPCPSCPDGHVWTSQGQTGKECPTCKGKAYIGEDEDDETEYVENDEDDEPAF